MRLLNLCFPISTISKGGNLTSLIISLAVYIVAAAVLHIVMGLFTWMPLIGWIFRLIRGITDTYCLLGALLSVLHYFRIAESDRT